MSCTSLVSEKSSKAVLVIHGGAGWISRESLTDSMEQTYTNTLKESLLKGRAIIQTGGSSLDAVQIAIEYLED